MKISTVVPQKYFNGVIKENEREAYLQLLKQNFDNVGMIAFGQLKFLTQEFPEKEADYNWKVIDNFLEATKNLGLNVHYNTVINNKTSYPKWYWDLSKENKLIFLEKHIKTVIGRYKENFYFYKLVNEMVRDQENDFLGTGLDRTYVIAQMFKWAKETSPEIKLMINDFGNFYKRDIRQQYIELINRCLDQGAPIDIVGLQGHMWTFELLDDEVILKTLTEIKEKTKLQVNVTEFDISYDNTIHGGEKIDPIVPFITRNSQKFNNWFEYQKYAYQHFYDLCKTSDLVEELTFWGFVDENVAWERPGIGLYDEKMEEKVHIQK